MFCSKKVYVAVFAALIPLILIMAARYLQKSDSVVQQGQSQDAPPTLREAAATNPAPSEIRASTRLQIETAYGNLPLSFEPNRGQTNPRVKFLSRAGHRTLWLTQDEAVLAIGRQSRAWSSRKAVTAPADQPAPAVLRIKFLGANSNAVIAGEDQQPGTVNYFAGRPEQWRTKIPTYARVRYRRLYPGIDLILYGNKRELEYDLVVSRGADSGQIRLSIAGAESLRLDAEGNLVLKTAAGDVVQEKPRIYQRKGMKFVAIAGEYVINGRDQVGFRLGNYDSRLPVVIDPVLRFSTLLGGGGDLGRAIAVDSSNRAVVVGITCSPNFPTVGGVKPPTSGCSTFITKLDFTGSRLVFSSFIKDTNSGPLGPGVALDSRDNVYVTGFTIPSPTQFPITANAFQKTFGGGDADAYAIKLNSSGSMLVYATFLGGMFDDEGSGIAVDSSGNAYIAGRTTSPNFHTTSGVFQPACKVNSNGGCVNAFVTKLNADGSKAVYSTFLGGDSMGTQAATGIAVDGSGNAFITGETDAVDFPTTAGSVQPAFGGFIDGFAAELSSSGSHLIFSTFLGGTNLDSGHGIAVDALGNTFVTGSTSSGNFPVKNAFQPSCPQSCVTNAFVTKLDAGGRLVYSTYLGGTTSDNPTNGMGIAVTSSGLAYVVGTTGSTTFPTTQTAFQRIIGGLGNDDVFITKFDATGKLIYSSYLGGSGDEFLPAVAVDPSTNAYVTGTANFGRTNPSHLFPVTPGAFQQTPKGNGNNAFVVKVVSLCALSTTNRSVTICSPSSGSTVASPVRIIAGTTDVTPVKLTQIYLDGKKIFEQPLSAINVALPIAGGTHRLTVQGLDTAKVFFKKSISINVSPH